MLDSETTLSDETRKKALRSLAGMACDADDLRLLMDILGLNDRPMRSSPKLLARQGIKYAKERGEY
jgi:hypothetical protein